MHPRFLALAAATLAGPALAQQYFPQPQLEAVAPVSGQAGTTLDFKLSAGRDLDEIDRLLFTHPGIVATPKMLPPDKVRKEPRPERGAFQVRIAADVPPGLHEVRGAGRYGISTARRFLVSAAKQVVAATGPTDRAAAPLVELGAAFVTAAAPRDTVWCKVRLAAGDWLVADGLAARLDSQLDARLVLLDPDGNLAAKSRPGLGDDPALCHRAERAGEWFVGVHDSTYRGGPGFEFRLHLSTGPLTTRVEPPFLVAGKSAARKVFGYALPGGAPVQPAMRGDPHLRMATLDLTPIGDAWTARGADGRALRPLAQLLPRADAAVPGGFATLPTVESEPLAEAEPNDALEAPQRIVPPCLIAGRFAGRQDRDGYVFAAKKGDQWLVSALGRTMGRAEPLLVIQRKIDDAMAPGGWRWADHSTAPEPKSLSTDRRMHLNPDDPEDRFTATADGDYRVFLYNRVGRPGDGEPWYVLRVAKPQPDFRLVAYPARPQVDNRLVEPWTCVLRRGGTEGFQVAVLRRDGFAGAVELFAEGLPAGVTASPAIVPPWSNVATLVVRADANVPAFATTIRIGGRALVEGRPETRLARGVEFQASVKEDQDTAPARETAEIALALDASIADPARADLGNGQPLKLVRGGRLEIPIKVNRLAGPGAVNLRPMDLLSDGRLRANESQMSGPEGKVTIETDVRAPAGKFTFHVQGFTPAKFRRNPERAELAERDRKAVQEALDAAGKAQAKADANSRNAALASATAKRQLAAAEQAAQRNKQAATDGTRAALKQLAAAVETAAVAERAATKAAADARQEQRTLAERLQQATQDSARMKQLAAEREIRAPVRSNAVEVELVDGLRATVELPPSAALRPGAPLRATVRVTRDFPKVGEATISLKTSAALPNLNLEGNPRLGPNETSKEIKLVINGGVKPTEVAAELLIRYTHDGRPAPEVVVPIAFRVEPAERK